ncbi:MAG: enoyl-CoA hydratase [Deltaproteobacteria bacterium]|nr:enoyl-CoA hydratase [Deltaproteobacteria bacterium]
MGEESVLRRLEDGVLLVTLNRPKKKNAFDEPQWDAFADALNGAREDLDVSVVVVNGAGGDFSAGVDLGSFGGVPQRTDGFASGYHKTMDALVRFDKPLIAAATGVGIGFGATFLFHCDVVYVGESVRLRLPFVRLGVVPEGASSYMLQAVVGARRAAELMYTAEWIDAARAVETGIATRAFPDAQLLEAALAKAREIAQHPVSSLRATKRTLQLVHADGIRRAIEAEDAGMKAQVGSPENVEAITAFLEKRPPDFRKLRS